VATLRDNEPPPAELSLSWDCQRWHTLPEAGGMLDQDAGLIHRMKALTNIYTAVSAWFNLKGKDIHRMSEQTRRMLRSLLDAGINFNA
jgi:hypothetical protein